HALSHCSHLLSYSSAAPHDLPSFPTRRSSDLRRRRKSGAERRLSRQALRSRVGMSGSEPLRGGGSACHTCAGRIRPPARSITRRSEEHTSELQSRFDLVCRLLLEKKKKTRKHAKNKNQLLEKQHVHALPPRKKV